MKAANIAIIQDCKAKLQKVMDEEQDVIDNAGEDVDTDEAQEGVGHLGAAIDELDCV